MSAIFVPNSIEPKSLQKSMLKNTLHKWQECYICAKKFKAKIFAQKNFEKVHYLRGMSAIFVPNSLKPISLHKSMLKKYTT